MVLWKQTTSDLFPPLSISVCLGQVIRTVIRRVSTPTPENQGSHMRHHKQFSPVLHEDRSEVGRLNQFDMVLGEHWWKLND